MIRTVFLLLLIIVMNNRLVAQQTKATPDSPASSVGMKKKKATATDKRSNIKTAAPTPTSKQATNPNQPLSTPAAKESQAIVSEIIKVDFRNMPQDVQSKVNTNKSQGKNLLEGISKVFLVEIKSCITDADQEKTLSFLKSKKGFIQSQFVSAGLVKIIVEPTFDSAELKEAMGSAGIQFNFLNRSYLLKN